MIGLLRDVKTGEPVGIHRTALADDGCGKRAMPEGLSPKQVLGRARGTAIMLARPHTILGIAEGIETSLSAAQINRIPVWAALSAGGIAAFPILDVDRLLILADGDSVGVSAAEKCARRYRAAGIGGAIRMLPNGFNDWNDFVRTRG